MELTACKFNTRGKGTKELVYQGVGKLVISQVPVKDETTGKTVKKDGKIVTEPKESLDSDGSVTDIKVALELEDNDMQKLLNHWANGFNSFRQRLASDELVPYIKTAWNKEQIAGFRETASGLLDLARLKSKGEPLTEAQFNKAIKIATDAVEG